MENKNLNAIELELTQQLLDVVNSKEEFEFLKAEELRLGTPFFHIELEGGAR